MALPAPCFQAFESRVVRELISIVLSYQVCGTLLWQPRKINTPLLCSFSEKWVHEEIFQNVRERSQSTVEMAGSAPHRNSSFSPTIISRDQKYSQEESFGYSPKFTLRKYSLLTREVIVIEIMIIIITESMPCQTLY